jgi:hypothetical protein
MLKFIGIKFQRRTPWRLNRHLFLDEVGHFPLVFGISDKCLCFNCDTWTH